MKIFKNLPLLLIIFFTLTVSCNTGTKPPDVPEQNENNPLPENSLKVGGLYLLLNEDSSYYVVKILALDDLAVHLRIYSDNFKEKPIAVSSNELDVLIGHTPLSKEGFLKDKPSLIKVENVTNDELEGYKIYLEEMEK